MEFGPLHLWEQMTIIAKGVVVALLLLSIWSLYVTIERMLVYRKAKKQSLAFAKQVSTLFAQDRAKEALDVARKSKWSHVARVTQAGLIQMDFEKSLGGAATVAGHDPIEAAKRAIERETLIAYSDLKKGVGSLATIATTAPFIGLFGTVIGIMNAFAGMAKSGSGGIAAVSGGIAEALVTTALGLFVAIPAAWMFNHFTNILERFQVEMSNSSSELLDFFIKKQGGTAEAPVRHQDAGVRRVRSGE
jgi:biopolymer transport protein ExbB/biopolymer transport protein TolQ